MKDKRDSSLSFSLAELESLEQERRSREQREREARASRHREAQARAAERARREQEARAAAEAERQREDEERRRMELARAEALQKAEVERIRAEVEARTRVEREQAARLHEIELEKVRALTAQSRQRVKLGASAFAIVSLGVFSAWLGARLREFDAARDEAEARSTMDRDAVERSARELDTSRRETELLRRALDAARSGGASEPAATSSSGVAGPGPSRIKGRPARTPATVSKCTNDGDPMNGCLEK